jgi:putative transposase
MQLQGVRHGDRLMGAGLLTKRWRWRSLRTNGCAAAICRPQPFRGSGGLGAGPEAPSSSGGGGVGGGKPLTSRFGNPRIHPEPTTLPTRKSEDSVFSTKRREPWITQDIATQPYRSVGGIVRAERGVLFDIGGVEDHVHLYLRWRPDETGADLMRTVKARSSLFVHQTFPKLDAFAWQKGYSAFSVSKSQEEAVKKYIAGQLEHHKKEDFRSELLRLLRAHEVEFDERFVFD